MTTLAGSSRQASIYTFDNWGRLKSYKPPLPANYGTINYTWTLAGFKESMQVPTGDGSTARKFIYKYDNEGRLVGTDVVTVTGLGGTATALQTATSEYFAGHHLLIALICDSSAYIIFKSSHVTCRKTQILPSWS